MWNKINKSFIILVIFWFSPNQNAKDSYNIIKTHFNLSTGLQAKNYQKTNFTPHANAEIINGLHDSHPFVKAVIY